MSETKFTRWYATQPAGGFAAIREQVTDRLIFHVANPTAAHGDLDTSDEEKECNLELAAQAPELRAELESTRKERDEWKSTAHLLKEALNLEGEFRLATAILGGGLLLLIFLGRIH